MVEIGSGTALISQLHLCPDLYGQNPCMLVISSTKQPQSKFIEWCMTRIFFWVQLKQVLNWGNGRCAIYLLWRHSTEHKAIKDICSSLGDFPHIYQDGESLMIWPQKHKKTFLEVVRLAKISDRGDMKDTDTKKNSLSPTTKNNSDDIRSLMRKVKIQK